MGCRGRIAAIVATCVDARPVLAIVAGSLYVVAVVATVLGRAEAEGADATSVHTGGLDAIFGLMQMVATTGSGRQGVIPLFGTVQLTVGVALMAGDRSHCGWEGSHNCHRC